jgi:hypothetical protein
MSGYGSNKTSDGKVIAADDVRLIPVVGIVENCVVKGGFEMSEDGRSAGITFVQGNGAEVTHKEWGNEEAASIDDTNRRVKHICTKLMAEDVYLKAVASSSSFDSFIANVNKAIAAVEGLKDMKFRMIFHYNNKGYVTVPRYPNFIESMSVNPTKLVVSNYVQKMLVKPTAPQADPELNITSDDITEGLPF